MTRTVTCLSRIVFGALIVCFAAICAHASEIEPFPGQLSATTDGRTILTLTEGRQSRNFSLGQVEKLEIHQLKIDELWPGEGGRYQGVLLRDLLSAAGLGGAKIIRITALDDYAVTLDLEEFDPQTIHGGGHEQLCFQTHRPTGVVYLAMALPRSDGMVNRCSFATDRADGFTDDKLACFDSLRPLMGLITELQGRARMTWGLLDLYLGPFAGPRVYNGEIKRGEGASIRSVLWISDLRGFTKLSESLPLNALTAVMNDYFEAMIGPIHAHGGEVLKMMGDGILACFPIDPEEEMASICERALHTAELAMANMALLNRRRRREDKPSLQCGIGLHVGDAMYGNVGAPDRLDFTVIGPAVNLCARLETLAGELGEPILCSAEFAEKSGLPMQSVGRHELKNVNGSVEAFVPAAD